MWPFNIYFIIHIIFTEALPYLKAPYVAMVKIAPLLCGVILVLCM